MIGLCPDLKRQRIPSPLTSVVVRREDGGWRVLVLRSFRNWDFPKGAVEPNETPLDAAIRETAEESSITDLAFRWGEVFCETVPYGRGKVARYLAVLSIRIVCELGKTRARDCGAFSQAERLAAGRNP